MSERGKDRRRLSRQELESIRGDLLRRRSKLWQEIGEDITKDAGEEHRGLLETISRDAGDRALAELRESTIYAYVELKADELGSIREALERMEKGEYGRCSDCGRWIRPARLKLVPYAVRCRSCQESWERLNA